jgi:hypothetical protein
MVGCSFLMPFFVPHFVFVFVRQPHCRYNFVFVFSVKVNDFSITSPNFLNVKVALRTQAQARAQPIDQSISQAYQNI